MSPACELILITGITTGIGKASHCHKVEGVNVIHYGQLQCTTSRVTMSWVSLLPKREECAMEFTP